MSVHVITLYVEFDDSDPQHVQALTEYARRLDREACGDEQEPDAYTVPGSLAVIATHAATGLASIWDALDQPAPFTGPLDSWWAAPAEPTTT